MKKTPKLNIFSGPEAILRPVLTVDEKGIVLGSDTVKLLRLKKADKVELANRQNNRKKWYIRRSTKSGYAMETATGQTGHTVAVLKDADDVKASMLKSFGESKILSAVIDTKEEFNGWYAVNFLPIQI